MINDYKLNGIDLKPGMVLTTDRNKHYIVFPGYYEELSLVEYGDTHWASLPWREITDNVVTIRESVGEYGIGTGEIIWQKETTEITMDEIAKKFNIPVACLRIKK